MSSLSVMPCIQIRSGMCSQSKQLTRAAAQYTLEILHLDHYWVVLFPRRTCIKHTHARLGCTPTPTLLQTKAGHTNPEETAAKV